MPAPASSWERPGTVEPPPAQEPFAGGPEAETPEVLDRQALLRWAVVRTSLSLAATGGAKLVPSSSPFKRIVESPGGMAKMYVPSLIS